MLHRLPRVSLLLAVLALCVALAACDRSDASLSGDFEAEAAPLAYDENAAYVPELEGALRVLSATPYGPMPSMLPEQAVAVTFTKPMTALGEDAEPPPAAFRITPAVEGRLYWQGAQTLVFQPEAPLPPATAFTVQAGAGLAAADGEALAAPYTWRFETPRPAVVRSEPADGAIYVDPRQAVALRFNQRIEAGAAARFIRLEGPDGRRAAVQTTPAAGDSALLVRPQQPLAQGARHRLVVLPGLAPAVGALPKADTTTIAFTTYGRPAFTAVEQPGTEWERAQHPGAGFDPERAVTLVFATPVRFADLRRALRISPALPLPPGIEAQDDVTSAVHTLQLNWAPETVYTIAVRNLKDQFGQTLAEGAQTFRTRAYAPSVRMPEGLVVLEAGPSVSLPVRATNTERLRLGARRLRPEDIVPLIDAYDVYHYYGERSAPPRAPIAATRAVPLGLKRNRPGLVALRLDSLLRGGVGLVAVHAEAPELPESAARDFRAIVQATRMGITGKFSAHENLFFVTDLATAQPVAGAVVTVRDRSNRLRWKGKTDAQGRAAGPGWARLKMAPPSPWEHPVQFAFAQRGDDVAFTSSTHRDGIDPYRFDIEYQWRPEAAAETGSIFTDRGLYRAGETAHVKGILRRKTTADWQPIAGPVRILIQSPRDQIALDRTVTAGPLGTFDFEWAVPASAAQGPYTVRVVHPADTAAARRSLYEPGDLAQGEFRVDAFRTASFAVDARTSAPSYTAGDFFEGSISGRYLFGAAMMGQPVQYTLSLDPGDYAPPGFEGYRFGTWDDLEGADRLLAQADTLLSEDGMLRLRRPLPLSAHGGAMQLTWTGAVTDPARQQSADRAAVTVHPGLYYIGLKLRSTFIDVGRRRDMQVDVITVDPAGRPVPGQIVEVELVRRQWNSVREVGADGRLAWRSEPTEEAAGRHRIKSQPGKAVRVTMPVEQGGSYVLRATGADVRGNTIRSEAFFYATGGGYVAWERADDDRIEIVPERTSYRPGETARLMVQSPYTSATALVTIEREGILSSSVMTLEGTAPRIDIPLGEKHMPNVFVSVVLLSGRTAAPGGGADVGAPGFKVGYTTLHVDPGVRRLSVDVAPERKTYRPGDEVVVDLTLRDAAGKGVAGEIAFSAADAGVLNLVGYALPDPFEAFYGARPLGVSTSETRARLVEQRSFGQKEEAVGGGGGDRSELMRRDFRPLAHWAPALRTDSRGRVRVRFRLPESLTTFRLMAAALAGGNRFGAGRTDITVTQPLVMQPALPRFVRAGDTFEAGVLLTNLTGSPGQAVVTASATGARLAGPNRQAVALRPGETREVRFRWAAPAEGRPQFTFNAALGAERDALALAVPVLLPAAKQTDAVFAAAETSVRVPLRLPAGRVPGLGSLTVRLSTTALVGLDGAARYLFEYPYGCLEQRTSAVRPLLVGAELIEGFGLKPLGGDARTAVEQWLADLNDFWLGDGFAMWPGQRRMQPYLSGYVVLALAEARDAGFQTPAFTPQAVQALAADVRKRSERPDYLSDESWQDTRAFLLYVLARHGAAPASEIDALAEQAVAGKSGLSAEGFSLLLRAVSRSGHANLRAYQAPLTAELRRRIRMEATTAYVEAPGGDPYAWIFASDTRATAYTLAALAETARDADTRQIGMRLVRHLMATREGGHWSTTQDNAAVLDAFQSYYRAFETTAPELTVSVRAAGRELLRHAFRGRSAEAPGRTVPLRELPASADAVEVTRSGAGLLYYSMLLETYTTAPQRAENNGIAVERRIQRLDDRGRPVGGALAGQGGAVTLAAGEMVRVTLRLASPTERTYVVVDDALPAGLEALNAAFTTTNQEALGEAGAGEGGYWGAFNHTEIRDDRVLLFADYLWSGEYTYTYVARATTPGVYAYPPARAEMMYRPEVNGRTAGGRLVVQAPAPLAGR